MTSIEPRPAYTPQELERLYPKGLTLQLVQVLLRHGERSPVSARFRNAGLPAHWPYCVAAKQIASIASTSEDMSSWDELKWARRMETFGADDGPVIAEGPRGEVDGVCQLGELTDKGRLTTWDLGRRLRRLYVDQLGFMPKLIADADMIYLRATPIPRALESVQQCFWGLYPTTARTAAFPAPIIMTRTAADETLFPNESYCRRFSQLSRAFAQRTADRWNDSTEMEYLNKMISKWMPPESSRVAVDSHPRLSGIMDTMNSTLAHGPETRLPPEFYGSKFRTTIEKIGVEEWFSGFKESQEYRQVGIGGLVGDIVERMVGSAEGNANDGMYEVGNGGPEAPHMGRGGEKSIRMALSGCHDTTLAAILASLGAFNTDRWPPYTSHVAIELFRKESNQSGAPFNTQQTSLATSSKNKELSSWSSVFGTAKQKAGLDPHTAPGIARRPVDQISPKERTQLGRFYVRMRYNDTPVTIPSCRKPGNHLEGDETFCTLEAFKRVADKFTPKSWRQACEANLDAPTFPQENEEAGY